MNKNTHIHLWSFSALVVTSILFSILLNDTIISSYTTEMASCMPSYCFCEHINTHSSIKQFSNTISSFAFVYVGWLILFKSILNKNTLMKLFGIVTLSIGVGSAFFHATLSFLGQVLDLAGMFLLSSFILFYALYRIYNLSKVETIVLIVVINIILDVGLFIAPEMRRYLFAILTILGLGHEYFYIQTKDKKIETTWLKYAFITLLISFSIWVLDITKIVCSPKSIVQGHAIWHVLSAMSIYFLYRYYQQKHKSK